jgi:hypothetical protein
MFFIWIVLSTLVCVFRFTLYTDEHSQMLQRKSSQNKLFIMKSGRRNVNVLYRTVLQPLKRNTAAAAAAAVL